MDVDPRDDLDRLDRYLASPDQPDDLLTMSQLDGFLTAIAISPQEIPPEVWLPEVWGGVMPPLAVQVDSRWVVSAIMSHYETIRQRLAVEPLVCTPILEFDDDGKLLPETWAHGFMLGVDLRRDAWEPLFKSQEFSALLAIAIFTMPVDQDSGDDDLEFDDPELDDSDLDAEELDTQSEFDKMRRTARENFSRSVTEIHRFWRTAEKQPTAVHRPLLFPGKVGRNAPCPCGSGKKFKRCCGAD